jgi:twin BRCT domain
VQIRRLKLLGIKVSKSFGEQVTHLVWCNGSGTRVAAAVLMGVIVVNTGWIDKFEESRGNVLDSEHQVVSGIQRTEAAAAVLSLSGKRARSAVSLCTTKIDPPKKDGQQGWSVAKRTSKARLTGYSKIRENRYLFYIIGRDQRSCLVTADSNAMSTNLPSYLPACCYLLIYLKTGQLLATLILKFPLLFIVAL